MNSSNPANKPAFQTPIKPSPNLKSQQTTYKKASITNLSNKNKSENPQQPDVPQTARFSPLYTQRPQQRTNRPYLVPQAGQYPYSAYSPYASSYPYTSPSPFLADPYAHSIPDLLNLIAIYEQQISILKQYIHNEDLIQRRRIMEIFGFQYGCCKPMVFQESKVVLKELTIKIRRLIQENNVLKGKEGTKGQKDKEYDEMLVKQNSRLRMIIDEYKNSQDQDFSNAKSRIYKLETQNKDQQNQIQKLKSKISALQSQPKSKNLQTIIPQIPPIRPPYSQSQSQAPSPYPSASQAPDNQYSKKQLTKQMFQLQQELQQKNNQNMKKIGQLEKKVLNLEEKLKNYQKERQYKIDSTIRKSFVMSTNIKKLKGEENQNIIGEDDEEKGLRQEGKIRNTNQFAYKKQQFLPQATPNKNQNLYSNFLQNYINEIKLSQDSLSMQKLKNKNLQQQNHMLNKKLAQLQQQLSQKIQRNIKLENIISQLEKQQQKEQKSQNIEQQLQSIINTLKSCNTENFQIFFKQFNQILNQRKQLSATLTRLSSSNPTKSKSKDNQQRNILMNKIAQLIDQNKRLLSKISDLETEIQHYHEEIIRNEIEKLNNIHYIENKPNGEEAIMFQRVVKASIEGALRRLEELKLRIKMRDGNTENEKDKTKKVQQATAQKSKIK